MIRTSFKIVGVVVVLVVALLTMPGQSQAHWHGGCGWGGCGYGGWGYGGYGYGGWGYGGWGYGGWGYGGWGYGGWGYSGYGYGGCGYGGCGGYGYGGCGYGYGGCGYGGCGYSGYGNGGCASCGGYTMSSTVAAAPMVTLLSPKPGSTQDNPNDGATIAVSVPEAAKVYVNGYLTKSTGSNRRYTSSGLTPGFSYNYEVRAEITRDGKTIEEIHRVVLSAGSQSTLAFKFNDKALNVASTW